MRLLPTFVIALALAGCATDQAKDAAKELPPTPIDIQYSPDPPTEAEKFADLLRSNNLPIDQEYIFWPVVDSDFTFEQNHVKGEIKNYSDKTIHSLKIEFDLLDPDEAKVGVARDYLPSLGPGETWRYSCYTFTKGSIARGPLISFREITGDPRYR